MTWSFSWQGKAQDYDPSLVQIGGPIHQRAHAQAMARAAFDAIAEWPPEQPLTVSAHGHAADDGGQAVLNVAAYTPTPLDEQLAAQQPVSVLPSGVPTTGTAADTTTTVTPSVGQPRTFSGPPSMPPSEPPEVSSPTAGHSEVEG